MGGVADVVAWLGEDDVEDGVVVALDVGFCEDVDGVAFVLFVDGCAVVDVGFEDGVALSVVFGDVEGCVSTGCSGC